jgi:hypothetical protein
MMAPHSTVVASRARPVLGVVWILVYVALAFGPLLAAPNAEPQMKHLEETLVFASHTPVVLDRASRQTRDEVG